MRWTSIVQSQEAPGPVDVPLSPSSVRRTIDEVRSSIVAQSLAPCRGGTAGSQRWNRNVANRIVGFVDRLLVCDPADHMGRNESVEGGPRGARLGGEVQGPTTVGSPSDQASVINRKHLRSPLILVSASVNSLPAARRIDLFRRRKPTDRRGRPHGKKLANDRTPHEDLSPPHTRSGQLASWNLPSATSSPGPGHLSGERASGGSCEASRSPFGGEPSLKETATPMGWMLKNCCVKPVSCFSCGSVSFVFDGRG